LLEIHHFIIAEAYEVRLARLRRQYYYGKMSEINPPFTSLGNHLKYVREQARQTVAEVSGAVEIDEKQLSRIEAGVERPSEDILLLLINYFGLQDREAVQLWEQAAYDSDLPEEIMNLSSPSTTKPLVMLLAMDMRAIYSDGVEIVINPAGLTLNFSQSNGKNPATPAARVGMSLEQAEQVLNTLQQAIMQAKYNGTKRLEPPKTD
jgi:transcriptional regulator with XRE-family HTH domain